MFLLKLKTESLTEQYGDHRKLSIFACYFFAILHATLQKTLPVSNLKSQ